MRLIAAARALVERFVPRGALLLSVLTFASYAMGLVRDRAFARTFGAGHELDAYNAAFVLPELLLDVLVASGLTAPFIPIFTRLGREDPRAAEAFGRTVMTAAAGVMAVVAVVLFIVAPFTVGTIAPGFAADPARSALYVELFRLMCVTPVIFAASITLGEVLVANRRFLHYGLAPILYNAGIVGGTLLLAGSLGIHAAAIGAVAGALLHLGIRVVGIVRVGFPLRPAFALRTPEFLEFLRLMAPKMASHPIEPLTFLFFTALATTIADGAASSVSFARNFQSVPVSLIGVAFSLAVFPTLSAHAAAGDRAAFIGVLRTNLVTIAAGSIAAAVALAIVAEFAIGTLLGGGRFDGAAVARTGGLLAAFAVSVPLEALTHPLARAIYATRNTTWPVVGSILGLVVTVGAVLWLRPGLGLTAIPLGFAAGAGAKLVVLVLAVGPRVRRIGIPG